MTSQSPLVVTSCRLRYHASRGLRRSFSFAFAGEQLAGAFDVARRERFAVMQLDSLAQPKGQPSPVLSLAHDQSVAKSGQIDCRLFCGSC